MELIYNLHRILELNYIMVNIHTSWTSALTSKISTSDTVPSSSVIHVDSCLCCFCNFLWNKNVQSDFLPYFSIDNKSLSILCLITSIFKILCIFFCKICVNYRNLKLVSLIGMFAWIKFLITYEKRWLNVSIASIIQLVTGWKIITTGRFRE